MDERRRSADLFPTDKELSPEKMIGRDDDVSEFSRLLANGISLVVAGPRRTGKTSVCKATLEALRRQGAYVVSVDLFVLGDTAGLAEHLVVSTIANRSALHRAVQRSRTLGRSALRAAQLTVRAKAMQELGEDLEIAFTPGAATERSLSYALGLLQRIAEADDRQVVLFVDEFQELAGRDERFGRLDTTTQLMAGTLKRSPRVTCLFAGSVEHLLQDLFTERTRAFYRFGQMVSLSPIERDAWESGLMNRLAEDGCELTADGFSLLMERCGGHPRATMLVMQQAHDASVANGVRRLDASLIEAGWQAALRSDTPLNVETVERMKELASGAFVAARAIAHGESPYKRLHSQTARRAIAALERAGIIEVPAPRSWRISDPTLRAFLESMGS